MTKEIKNEITKISKQFVSGFKPHIQLKGSGWLIVDPLSAYLNSIGYVNKLQQIPAKKNQPQVLIIVFPDGTQFIPASSDIIIKGSNIKNNWLWID